MGDGEGQWEQWVGVGGGSVLSLPLQQEVPPAGVCLVGHYWLGWEGSFAISLSREMLCLLLKAFGLKECVSNAGRGQSSASGNC